MSIEALDKVLRINQSRGMPPDLAERIARILSEIDRRSLDPSIYDDECRSPIDEVWNDVSGMLNHGGNFNLIPSGHIGHCQEICFILSSNHTRRRNHINRLYFDDDISFPKPKQGLRLAREHMIKCAATCRVVIFFTDFWDEKIFEEGKLDFSAQETVHNKWLLPILVSSGGWIAMSWR